MPPEDPDVAIYCGMLRSELHGYVPSAKKKNFDFVDRAARKWLARHKEDVAVVDADKNLGDVLICGRVLCSNAGLRVSFGKAFILGLFAGSR